MKKLFTLIACLLGMTAIASAQNTLSVFPTVAPVAGDVVALNKIMFEAPDVKTYLPDNPIPFILEDEAGTKTEVMPTSNNGGFYVFLNLPEIITKAGKYTITVPKGAFEFFSGDALLGVNEERKLEYNVTGAEFADFAVTTDPAQGPTLDLSNIYLYFTDAVRPIIPSGLECDMTFNGEPVDDAIRISYSAGTNRFLIYPNFGGKKGEYVITVPKGILYTADGKLNNEMNLRWTVMSREFITPELTVTPAPGRVEYLSTIEISIPADGRYTAMELIEGGIAKAQVKIGDAQPVNKYLEDNMDGKKLARLKFDPAITEICDVEVNIAEGEMIITTKEGESYLNNALRYVWRISSVSVEDIEAENNTYTVYNLQGVRLLENGSKEEFKALGSGVYVVNGKTYFVK